MIPLSQCISVRYDFHSALEDWIDYELENGAAKWNRSQTTSPHGIYC